jgi:glycosyltransferase involved in cell wall biosynthesis
MTLPTLSLIMYFQNEATFVCTYLESIATQEYEGALELIVVDGTSEDSTRVLLEPFHQQILGMVLIDNPQRTLTT